MPNDAEIAVTDGYGVQDATPPGSMAWFCCLFAPAADRPRLRALYAFRAELDRIAHQTAETDIARIKLAWWREEIGRFARGLALHPIGRALSSSDGGNTLDESAMLTMIDAAETELLKTRFPELEDLLNYTQNGGGSFFRLLAQIQTKETATDTAKHALTQIGAAGTLIEKIRDLRRDLALGQVFLPLEWLDRGGLTVNDLMSPSPSEAALSVVQNLGDQVSRLLTWPSDTLTMQSSTNVQAALSKKLHTAIASNEYRGVFEKEIELTGFQMLWTAWRAATRTGSTPGK